MAVTNSRSRLFLLNQLRQDYIQYSFRAGTVFRWAHKENSIYYRNAALGTAAGNSELLHELSHALLGHQDYREDIALLEMEAAAWSTAAELAPTYDITLDEAHAQACLESYREWLRRRSTCPKCAHTGIQTHKNTYSCINCRCNWRVNDAKFCLLRRSILSKQ